MVTADNKPGRTIQGVLIVGVTGFWFVVLWGAVIVTVLSLVFGSW